MLLAYSNLVLESIMILCLAEVLELLSQLGVRCPMSVRTDKVEVEDKGGEKEY